MHLHKDGWGAPCLAEFEGFDWADDGLWMAAAASALVIPRLLEMRDCLEKMLQFLSIQAHRGVHWSAICQ